MKLAHIILVHKNPLQVSRLIKQLYHPDIHCWVHVDSKSDPQKFHNLSLNKNVFLIQPSIRVDWGCFNTVEAMLNAMKTIMRSPVKYEYINILSGQDYPIAPPGQFLSYLREHAGISFLGTRPYQELSSNLIRIHKHHLDAFSFTGKKLVERIMHKFLPDRKFPFPFDIRKGPQWMTISRSAIVYILKFVKENPSYSTYFKTVHIPDEFFFQTILRNSPYANTCRDQVFHYTDWSENKRHPRILRESDYNYIIANPLLFFARKFDEELDAKILDRLDREKLSSRAKSH